MTYKGERVYPSFKEMKETVDQVRKGIKLERGLSAAQALGKKTRKRNESK